MVATRKPDPLVITLQGAAGKSFHNDDVNLTILDIRVTPVNNQTQTSIDVMVRSTARPSAGFTPPGGTALSS